MITAAVSISPSVAGALIGGLIAAFATGSVVYFQQKNRRTDKVDAAVLNATGAKVQDTRDALIAWQGIVAANNIQILGLQSAATQLQAKNEAYEARIQALQEQVNELTVHLSRLTEAVVTTEDGKPKL